MDCNIFETLCQILYFKAEFCCCFPPFCSCIKDTFSIIKNCGSCFAAEQFVGISWRQKVFWPQWYTDCSAFHAPAILKHLKSAHFSTKNGYFSVFCGSRSHAFSCKHETHDFLTLVSSYNPYITGQKNRRLSPAVRSCFFYYKYPSLSALRT